MARFKLGVNKPILSKPLIFCLSIASPEIALTDSEILKRLSSLLRAVTITSSKELEADSPSSAENIGNAKKLAATIKEQLLYIKFIMFPNLKNSHLPKDEMRSNLSAFNSF